MPQLVCLLSYHARLQASQITEITYGKMVSAFLDLRGSDLHTLKMHILHFIGQQTSYMMVWRIRLRSERRRH